MKKLLLIGSGSVHIYNFYNLIKDYFDEILLLTDGVRNEFDVKLLLKANFSINNPIKGYLNHLHIKKVIQNFQPDIIHVHQANSTAFLTLKASKNTGIPVILTAWGSDVLITPSQGILKKNMVLYNLNNANYLTADSQSVILKINELTGRNKDEILYANFGIDNFYKNMRFFDFF